MANAIHPFMLSQYGKAVHDGNLRGVVFVEPPKLDAGSDTGFVGRVISRPGRTTMLAQQAHGERRCVPIRGVASRSNRSCTLYGKSLLLPGKGRGFAVLKSIDRALHTPCRLCS